MMKTNSGVAFAMLPPQAGAPAPTLLLFASTGQDTLSVEPYFLVGRLLNAQGWNVVSMDLPCHGADRRAGEPEQLAGWAARISNGEDIVAAFQTRVNDVIAHMVSAGIADPARIAAAGTSRGGFLAFHAAAGNQLIRAVAAFAPVTDLLALSEFAGREQNPLAQRLSLVNYVEALSDRSSWITIGNADTRVDTDKAVAFFRELERNSHARSLYCNVTLRMLPVPGHCSYPEWHDEAAEWFLQTVVSTVRTLPAKDHPLAVPCTVFPPVVIPGRKPGLVVHLYGYGGSHSFFNMIRPLYAPLRRSLREAGYWLIVPDLGPSHWMNARSVSILDAIIAEIVAKDGVDPDRVHLLGTSMGGGSSLIYASKRPKTIRSVCAVFPMTDLDVWTTERPGYLSSVAQAHGIDTARATTALHDISPIHHIEAFSKIPIFLLHGEADQTVPVHHSRDFAASLKAIGGDVVYHEVPGVGHDDGIATDWQEEIFSFIINTGAVRKTIKS